MMSSGRGVALTSRDRLASALPRRGGGTGEGNAIAGILGYVCSGAWPADRRHVTNLLLAACLAITCSAEDAPPAADPPKLYASPELRESPLLDALLTPFAEETGVRVEVLPSPEGADLLLLPPKEPGTDSETPEREGREVCWTCYVLLGPPAGAPYSYGELNYKSWARGRSPLGTRGPITGSSASRLFQEIGKSAFPFVSRGDGSENHLREVRFWGPEGPCREVQRRDMKLSSYTETREAMDRTVAIADENSAYALCDLATFLRLRKKVRLAVVLARDAELRVAVRATLADAPAEPADRWKGAKRLYDWLGSDRCRAALKKVGVDGERPFYAPGEDLAPTLRGRLDPEPPFDDEAEDEGR
jgi:ABC-type tungstate transport system permease subunit